MTEDIDVILKAKETRQKTIQSYLVKHQTVVTLKPNIPGDHKHTDLADLLLVIFHHYLKQLWRTPSQPMASDDGDYILFGLEKDPIKTKKLCLYLEDNHHLGRFIDLDVHHKDMRLTRKDMQVKERTCFICAKPASQCRREGNHSKEALYDHVLYATKAFLIEALSEESIMSLRKELFTYPCFGLVSHRSNGKHKDMNISHFLAALKVLKIIFKQYLTMALEASFNTKQLRQVGRKAEKRLLEATNGVNTHKGAHFIFGLCLPFYLQNIWQRKSMHHFIIDLRTAAAKIARDDFKRNIKATTNGLIAYHKYQAKGVRGELESGLNSIFDWYPHKTLTPFQKLCKIMARCEDTTLIKSHGYKALEEIQACMKDLETQGFKHEQKVQKCLKSIVSPGGAADLLALTFFFESTDHLLK